jgi:hypothetical protein
MLRFHTRYALLSLGLLIIEVLIALFVHDRVIRPFVGDVLVVILIYGFIRTFFRFDKLAVAVGTWLFAVGIEVLQYFNFAARLGFGDNKLLNIILGSTFDWFDILAYSLGIGLLLWLDKTDN